MGWCSRRDERGAENHGDPPHEEVIKFQHHHGKDGKNNKVSAPGRKPARGKSAKPAANVAKKAPAPRARTTKIERCLTLLNAPGGATIDELQAATGWQAHSVRGFLAGTVRKKLGLTLDSEKAEDGVRRYRVVQAGA